MGLPTIDVGIAFGTQPGVDPVYTWLDGTANRVRELHTQRGRNTELDRVEAGTGEAIFSNKNRALEPDYASGAYYPNVIPERQMQIKATWSGVDYFLSTTYIDEINPLWEDEALGIMDYQVQIRGVDAIDDISNAKFSGTRGAERSDLRLGFVLDQIGGWPASKRSLSVGDSTIQGYTFDSYGAKQHFDDVSSSENGLVFINGAGNIVFHNRQKRLKAPYLTSVATFGDAAGELPYSKVSTRYTKRDIYNYVVGQRANDNTAPVYIAQDATSISNYRQRSMEWTPWLTTDAEVQDGCNYRLSLYKDPKFRFTEIEIEPQMDDNLWQHALGREIGDRITIRRRPLGSLVISQDCFIESVRHDYAVGRWTTTWSLSPASQWTYWLVGTVGYSEAGQTTRAGY